MTNRCITVFVALSICLLAISGCSSKRGPAGPSASTECLTCHADDSVIRAIDGQWRNSVHASGNNIDRNVPPCSGCHTGEGFIERVSTGTPDTVLQPGVINCFACHEPHTNKNFNLRTMSAVTLIQGGTFDRSVGNLCANCHQARKPGPDIPLVEGPATDSITINSPYWGPHDGPQANVLLGLDAFVFTGATYSNSSHTAAVTSGCPTCHMATPFKNIAGGHQAGLTYSEFGQDVDLTNGCNTSGCHTNLTDFDVNGIQDSVSTLLRNLRTILITDAILSPDTSSITVNAPLRTSITKAGALYNFLLFHSDRSLGVHNTQYTMDALNASIEKLSTIDMLASNR
jgi:hypothetical protein